MKKIKLTIFFILIKLLVTAQVKVGDNVATLTNSAMLEIESTTMGLLIPRMTDTQIASITPLTTGLMVFNTTLNCLTFYNGTAWNCVGTTTNFTSGSIPFSNGATFTENNSKLFWDNTNFRLGIGTSTPTTKLSIKGTGTGLPVNSATTQSAGQFLRLSDSSNLVLDVGGNGTSAWLQSTNAADLSVNYPLLLNPNGGNVGIGINNPVTKLHIKGYGYSPPVNSGISQSLGHYMRFSSDYTNVILDIGNNHVGGFWLQCTRSNNLGDGQSLLLNPNGGNVGIGTGTDDFYEKLQVKGNIGLGDFYENFGTRFVGISLASTRTAGMEIENTTLGGNYSQKLHLLSHHYNNSAGRRLTIDEDGNVGIGTTSPAGRLHLISQGYDFPATSGSIQSAGLIARFSNPTWNTALDFGGAIDQGSWLQTTNTTDLSVKYPLLLNPTGGNVGIGATTNIYEKLQVNGNIGLGRWTDNFDTRYIGIGDGGIRVAGIEIQNTTLGGNYSQKLHISTHHWGSNYGRRLTINEDGLVGIGTETPSYKLHVNGSVAGTSAYINLSDKRFKKDILPLKNSLEKVMQLNGVSYNWDIAKAGNRNLDKDNHIGFIAQEVEKIFPQVVITANDEMKTKSIAYSDLIPVLAEAIKKLNDKIEKLQAEKKELKK